MGGDRKMSGMEGRESWSKLCSLGGVGGGGGVNPGENIGM